MAVPEDNVDTNIEERDDPRILWPIVALFWIVNVAMTTVQVYVMARPGAVSPPLLGVLRMLVPGYTVWFLSVPVIVLVLTRRFRFDDQHWRVSLPVHLAVGLVLATMTQVVDTIVFLQNHPTRPFVATLVGMARTWMLWAVFTYWFFVVLVLAVRHYTTSTARKRRAAELTAVVASAKLAMLRTQLHPHFLFNALNSISSLVFDQPREARKMIARLGELLRATLAEGDERSWALRRELELLTRYTEIEKVRFGDRLLVDITCDPVALDARVPALLLQPLVENAILHGIQPSLRGGSVRVAVRREGHWLRLEVDDDGIGVPNTLGNGERVGLTNTRERLQTQFGDDHIFHITRRDPCGTRVLICIPWSMTGRIDAGLQ